jgi:hypothetical protein
MDAHGQRRWLRTLVGLVAILLSVATGSSRGGEDTGPPAYRTATGRLAAYDGASRTLTLRSVIGLTSFHLADDARVWLGRKRVAPERLGQHLGAQATVAWAEVNGVPVTHTVRLSEGERQKEHSE